VADPPSSAWKEFSVERVAPFERGGSQLIVEVDLTDPDLYGAGDLHSVFDSLRRRPGLFWNAERDGPGFWAVTRYADAVSVYKDVRRFTSTRGTILRPTRRRIDPACGRMLVMTDAPRHTRLKQILNRGFTPKMVERLQDRLTSSVAEIVDAAIRQGHCDFVGDVSARIPVVAICELMGVPPEDWSMMYELTSTAFSSGDPDYALSSSGRFSSASAHSEILDYYSRLLTRRRRAPADDLVSVLAAAEIAGERLSDQEVLFNCDNLIVGGNETVRHAAAGGMLALLERPGELARLRSDLSHMDTAVEEMLRWTTPGMHVLRTCRRNAVVGGQTVRAGEQVVVWNISANRDAAEFRDPHAFDVSRSPNRHLALGFGEHYCLGAALARMELRTLMKYVLTHVSRMELIGPVRRLRSNLVSGFKRLPVELHPS